MNPVAQEILNAVDKIVPFAGRLGGGDTGSATVVVELGQETLRVFAEIQAPTGKPVKRIESVGGGDAGSLMRVPSCPTGLGCGTTSVRVV